MLLPRSSSLPRGLDGLPLATARETQIARLVLLIATLWFALVASWELLGPPLAGHFASSASMGIIAENMLRWRIPGPVWEYTTTRPTPAMYYCHHPWGIFWTTAAFMKVLGRHDVVCRLPAVLLSVATPPLLYALGRSLYRPAAGAAAAATFVVLPIALSFANFNALEVPVMAWTLLGVWGYVRLLQTWRKRWIAVSVLGLTLGMHADWPAFVLTGGLLAFGALRGFLAPVSVFGPVHPRRFAQWWVLTAAAAVLTLGLYLVLFQRAGKLVDLLQSYAMRSSGNEAPLGAVLASRRYWLELMFTPVGLGLGALGVLACLGRLTLRRREADAIPLLYFVMAAVQYVVFRQGADIHIFWPHHGAAYLALAMAALVDMGAHVTHGTASPVGGQRAWTISLSVALLLLGVILRDGIPALRYARETGGRFNEKGLLIDSDGDKIALLRWLSERIPGDARVDLHAGMKATWAQTWALGGRMVGVERPVPSGAPRGVYVADVRYLSDAVQADLVKRFRVVAVGPYWLVATPELLAMLSPGGPEESGIVALSFRETEPSALVWALEAATEPVRSIAPDPFLTWELRTHFDLPTAPPLDEPVTLEQRRIAHNAALASGDTAGASARLAEIRASLSSDGARFSDGTEILGATFQAGARALLTVVVQAGGPLESGVSLAVRSRVVARAWLSATMPDPVEREVGLPLWIAPERWRAGFLYTDPVPIRKRPGTEAFWASFRGKGAPHREGGGPSIEVLRLP
ncbi:ArnT family glycosyltransferase [Chondromyces crocatus]|uniref:Glycosyltransferase n=1 Tax=Chondromyces crocatus TaxID=52 RepID=A0A0K1EPH7_CHOCO|nr:glycosyltransferase family 39 protein [Chondromyces crocatus]AKT42756.1 glycosyltransferase [Chondromyces crocatus]